MSKATSDYPLTPISKVIVKNKTVTPLVLIILGLSCLLIVAIPFIRPLISFFIYPHPDLIYPLSSSSYPLPIIVDSSNEGTDDLTKASAWFIKAALLPSPSVSDIPYFSLSMPGSKLTDIQVKINGLDLKKGPIHYPGTSLPGDFGNTVIFGHSALPQFYRPKDPLTIFNPLTETKVGDSIHIQFAGISYIYSVKKIIEVAPDQIEVLSQDYSSRKLTLITCVPLGTYWRRLVIQADLVN